MIVDPKALEAAGYTQEKLKKLFTDAANPKLKKPSEEVIKVKSLIELHAQLGLFGVQAQQLAAAHQAIQATDAQGIACFSAVDVMQVLEAAAAEQHAVSGDKIAVFQ